MDNCVFCKISRGEIPAKKVYEDEYVFAFLDLAQSTPGHTLLVPKRHLQDIYAYEASDAQAVFSVLPTLSAALQKAFPKAKGLNIVINNGEVAGQTVFHSHIHLIPRYTKEDDFQIKWADHSTKYSNEELESIQHSIQDSLEG